MPYHKHQKKVNKLLDDAGDVCSIRCMENMFSSLSVKEIREHLQFAFPCGITFDSVVLTFNGNSVVCTARNRQRIGYRTWKAASVTRSPLRGVTFTEVDGGMLLSFGGGFEYRIEN